MLALEARLNDTNCLLLISAKQANIPPTQPVTLLIAVLQLPFTVLFCLN